MITVFTTNQCAYCVMVKKFLTMKGTEYKVVNIEDEPEIRKSLFKKTGSMTVPIIQKDEKYLVGWNPGKLAAFI